MWEIVVDKDKCSGDEECVNACPASGFRDASGKAEPVNSRHSRLRGYKVAAPGAPSSPLPKSDFRYTGWFTAYPLARVGCYLRVTDGCRHGLVCPRKSLSRANRGCRVRCISLSQHPWCRRWSVAGCWCAAGAGGKARGRRGWCQPSLSSTRPCLSLIVSPHIHRARLVRFQDASAEALLPGKAGCLIIAYWSHSLPAAPFGRSGQISILYPAVKAVTLLLSRLGWKQWALQRTIHDDKP